MNNKKECVIPATMMHEIVNDLRHSANVDGYTEMQAKFINSIADRLNTSAACVNIYEKYLIERQDAVGVSWDFLMSYSTLEQVRNALPYWRKDSKRPIRIVFEKREILYDTCAAGEQS